MTPKQQLEDGVRRRRILHTLDSRDGSPRLEAALRVLSGDELELVERLAARIARLFIGDVQELALSGVVARMLRGRASYGQLTIDSDPRSYSSEVDEEIADALIYDTLEMIRDSRQLGKERTTGSLPPLLNRLVGVGQRADLPQLVRNVQDRERPEPFAIPPPWCLGSALLFQHSAVRIEHDTIVAVRCHHCGREWALSSNELRLTGSGQYVIPTHEAAPDWRSLPPTEVG